MAAARERQALHEMLIHATTLEPPSKRFFTEKLRISIFRSSHLRG
jgi:hypothetical protein